MLVKSTNSWKKGWIPISKSQRLEVGLQPCLSFYFYFHFHPSFPINSSFLFSSFSPSSFCLLYLFVMHSLLSHSVDPFPYIFLPFSSIFSSFFLPFHSSPLSSFIPLIIYSVSLFFNELFPHCFVLFLFLLPSSPFH